MGRAWLSLVVTAGLLLGLGGCFTPNRKKVERPDLVEEYKVPPEEDARFSQPIAFPKKVMVKEDKLLKDPNYQPGVPPMPGRGGPMGSQQ